ncbi:MAG: hypothetical protein ACREYF_28320, partial [Gammaproteobacteria bacterium]
SQSLGSFSLGYCYLSAVDAQRYEPETFIFTSPSWYLVNPPDPDGRREDPWEVEFGFSTRENCIAFLRRESENNPPGLWREARCVPSRSVWEHKWRERVFAPSVRSSYDD